MKTFRRRCLQTFPEIPLILGLYGVLLLVFAALRLLMLWRNGHLGSASAPLTLAQSFLVGIRFDLAIASYLLILLFLLLVLLRRQQALVLVVFTCLVALLTLFGIAEAEFYRELEMRFNSLVFEYLSHPDIVGGMLWSGYPVLRYLLLWALVVLLLVAGIRILYRRLLLPGRAVTSRPAALRLTGAVCMLTLMVFAARGGFADVTPAGLTILAEEAAEV